MATSGEATGGNDVFNGKNRVFWWLVSQDPLAGANGESIVRWAWCVNWAVGDNCHTILNGQVIVSGNGAYFASTVHSFNGGHVHTGDYPSVNSGSGGGFATGTVTVVHDSSGVGLIRVQGSHVGTSGATSSSDTGVMSLPDIVQAPAAPTIGTAVRNSDTSITVNWTNNSTTHHEYASLKVQYQIDSSSTWSDLSGTLSASATSYSHTSASANHKYIYRVVATNAMSSANSASSNVIYTTPGTPTIGTATKQPNNDVVLTWSNNIGYGDNAYTTRVEASQNGGAFAELTGIAGPTSSYTHVAPSTSVTWTYRVRHRSNTGSLNGSYSANSNTVQLLSTANAPTGLATSEPNVTGTARDPADIVTFSWVHNPTDGTAQSKYQLQWSINGGSTWTTVGPTNSSTQSYAMPAGTMTAGTTITWHVQTAGQNGTFSSYSSNSTFTVSAKPTATITAPGTTVSINSVTLTWTYAQAQSSAQATYRSYLLNSSAQIVEQINGTTGLSVPFTTVLTPGSWSVQVYVRSAAGIESAVATKAFTVNFLPPVTVTVDGVYQTESGVTGLTLTGAAGNGSTTTDISTVDVQRSLDGGLTWVTFASGVVLNGSYIAVLSDSIPTINGVNLYRAISYSILPSSAISGTTEVDTAEDLWCFLNTGNAFSTVAKFKAQPAIEAKSSRARALYHFAGRTKPVQLTGEAQDLVLTVSGMLIGTSSTPEEFENIAYTNGVVCWRDPTGRRIFASISDVITNRTTKFYSNVSFGLTEVDHDE